MSLVSQISLLAGAIATAINTKAPKASPAFTGNPTAPTPSSGDSDTSIATTAFVAAAVAAGGGGGSSVVTNTYPSGGPWPARPSGTTVVYDSTIDLTAPAPTDMVAGDSWLQAAPSQNFFQKMTQYFTALPNLATLTQGVGISFTAVGAATAAALGSANVHVRSRRVNFLVTTAATSAVAGWRETAASQYGTAGYKWVCRFGIPTGTASSSTRRMFVGLGTSNAVPTDVDASTITDIIGVGCDAGDTTLQFMHRQAAGTVVKSSTGFTKTVADATEMWELTMILLPGATTASMTLKRFSDGATISYTTTTAIPAATTSLQSRAWASVGGTSSVVGMSLMGIYTEVA